MKRRIRPASPSMRRSPWCSISPAILFQQRLLGSTAHAIEANPLRPTAVMRKGTPPRPRFGFRSGRRSFSQYIGDILHPNMAAPDLFWKNGRFAQTSRRDTWWLSPLLVFLGFGTFLVYATWLACPNHHYTYGPSISPF